MREGRWQTTMGVGLERSTLGVVGLGNLGGQVAAYGKAFGMNVIAWSRSLTPERAEEKGATLVTKDELFERSDFISVHVSLSDASRGLIGAPQFARMKPGALLINTSRGPVVDEAALVEALREGVIAGAALDVFEAEPRVHAGLLSLENVVLVPHLGSATVAVREAMGLSCVAALRSVLLEQRAQCAAAPADYLRAT